MRIAALYDIHGNLPALDAVLDEVRVASVDLVAIGGDVVPGPMANECLALLRALDRPLVAVQGNGELAVLAARDGRDAGRVPEQARAAIRWNADHLGEADARTIASWPANHRLDVEGIGAVLFCHATPRDPDEIFTKRTPEARLAPIFESTGAALVVCGHTHMPFDRRIGGVRVVNPGSVGMPFGAPGAYWLLIDRDVEFRRTSYDLRQAAQRIRTSGYPQADAFASHNVLDPPDEATMLAALTKSELT